MKTKNVLVNIDHKKAATYVLGGVKEGKVNEIAAEKYSKIQFYKTIEQQIKDYKGIVLAGHGKGSANELHGFRIFLKKKNKQLSDKIIGELVTDLHETKNQLLARADQLIGEKHIGNHNGCRL